MENFKMEAHKRGVLNAAQSDKVRALFNAMYPYFKNYLDSHYYKDNKEEEIADFLQLGFTPYFSFYGENNCLNPLISWYGFYGKRGKDYLNLVICANSSKEEYTVYKDNRKIGIFNNLDDILNLFKIKEYTPELSSIYTDFLLFEKNRLGEILKKAKSLMDNEEWNQMVEFATTAIREHSTEKFERNKDKNKEENNFNPFDNFEKSVQEQKQLFDSLSMPLVANMEKSPEISGN